MYIKKLTKGVIIGGILISMALPTYATPKNELDKIANAVRSYKESISIKAEGLTVTDIKNHIDSLGIYNTSGFKTSRNKDSYNIIFDYYESPKEMKALERLSSLIASEVSGLKVEDKVYHITQRISELMTYSHEDKESKLVVSPTAITNGGVGLCQSYARTAQIIFNKAGISNALITGSLPGAPHMWNIVKASNGEWYSVDVTGADTDENGKIDFSKVFMTKNQLKEYEYKVTKSSHPLSNKPIQKFDGVGLYSKINRKFYSQMLDGSDTIYSYNLTTDALDVEGYGDDYWTVGGELFIKNNSNIINTTNYKPYYESLNETDVVTNKGAELKVNDKVIYNSSNLPKGKVFVIDSDFKVAFANTKQYPLFYAEELPNRTNIYYNDVFLVQYLRKGR